MVLESISQFLILGRPLIFWMGIITYTLLIATAGIALGIKRNILKIPFKWHIRIAIVTIIWATLHGLLGILSFF